MRAIALSRFAVTQLADAVVRPCQKFSTFATEAPTPLPAWVFLGPPGVGKGTYSTRISEWLGIPQVAAGDLIRQEMRSGSSLGKEMARVVNTGNLLPDEIVTEVVKQRIHEGRDAGEVGVLLDGFPRTAKQAKSLVQFADVQLALNLSLREDILIAKCLGRRICKHCGKNYNVADVNLQAAEGRPAIRLPPLAPSPECADHLEVRADDVPEVVRRRLDVYKTEAGPVEHFFSAEGLLANFEVTGGIPETLSRLLRLLAPYADALKHGPDAQHLEACTG